MIIRIQSLINPILVNATFVKNFIETTTFILSFVNVGVCLCVCVFTILMWMFTCLCTHFKMLRLENFVESHPHPPCMFQRLNLTLLG